MSADTQKSGNGSDGGLEGMAQEAIKIARTAKGKKPQYFSDPAIDKLLSITLTVMQELSVTRDRLDTVERLLEEQNVLAQDKVDNYKPQGAASAKRTDDRMRYISRCLRVVTDEIEAVAGRASVKSQDDVEKSVS